VEKFVLCDAHFLALPNPVSRRVASFLSLPFSMFPQPGLPQPRSAPKAARLCGKLPPVMNELVPSALALK
jgi:hypothetical protein